MKLEDLYEDFFRREGWPKVTRRPSDRGGLTKGGITCDNFNRWRAAHGERPLTEDEFRILDQVQATAFLYDQFVRPLQFITDEPIFLMLVDLATNAGLDDAVKVLQVELAVIANDNGHEPDLDPGDVDGIPGPKTRRAWAALSRTRGALALDVLYRRILKRIIRLTVKNALDREARAFLVSSPSTQLHNLEGWINRRLEFL